MTVALKQAPKLAYYGDDFTGSTDVLEALAMAGVRAALFLKPPEPQELQDRFRDLEAVGVAGTSRSMPPDRMEAALPPVFDALNRLGPELLHYKICSTFDSSPDVGSIGRAIDIGQRLLRSSYVPMIVGAPILKRYCVFGNLFATVAGETHRLDRHPTMRSHPVTPMDEADLRLHLGRQTDKSIALMDVLTLSADAAAVDRRFGAARATGAELLLFDTLDERHLRTAGRLIWSPPDGARPRLVVGSSGVEYALVAHWRDTGLLGTPEPVPDVGPVDRLLVVSGSCSPTTESQIRQALERGFTDVPADPAALSDPEGAGAERRRILKRANRALEHVPGVIVHTAIGAHDHRVKFALEHWKARDIPPWEGRDRLAEQLGRILCRLVETNGLRRVAVAGGDTSGHAVRQLGIEALEFLMPTAPGSPLCRATSSRPGIDGLQIVLKGGQVGSGDFFQRIKNGLHSHKGGEDRA